ncbi:MAG: hypothetical protein RLZZ623_3464, partial [Actinomycetota bacterium]
MAAPDIDNLSATDRLRNEILAGALPPGERLVELQLAERYRLSRTAIRSALVELDSEGLVRREANRGATVRRVSLADAIEITQARGALEGLVARLAAERATTDERTGLCELVAAMERAVAIDARSEYAALNRALHRNLLQIARHAVANDLVANLRNRSAHHQYRLATVAGRALESLDQHRAIVTAVVAGDGAAAEAAMRAHLESVTAV